jgi:hypothetical protein
MYHPMMMMIYVIVELQRTSTEVVVGFVNNNNNKKSNPTLNTHSVIIMFISCFKMGFTAPRCQWGGGRVYDFVSIQEKGYLYMLLLFAFTFKKRVPIYVSCF